MTTRFARTAGVLAPVLAASIVVGCSLLVDTADRIQCRTTADCEANPALRNRKCQQGFCAVPSPTTDPVAADGGEPCTNTAVCTNKNSGRASICKAGQPCTTWQLENCPSITGDWSNPNAIVIGALLPFHFTTKLSAVEIPYTKRLGRAIDMASHELDTAAPAGFQIANAQRPIAVLQCDSFGDPKIARDTFTHLTDVVGAPVVITAWDEDVNAIAGLAMQKKVPLVCSDCLIKAPLGPTVWKILPEITSEVALIAWRVNDLEAKIKATTPGDIRVAVLVEGTTAPGMFSEELTKTLVFNGVPANATSAKYFARQTEDPRKDFVKYDKHDKDIVDFGPHIVVVAVSSDFPKYHLPSIEQGLKAQGKTLPYYVVTQLSYDAAQFETALVDDDLRNRVSGTHPYTSPELQKNITNFEKRYLNFIKSEAANGNFSAYEAFYATALSLAAASGSPVLDAARINAGFARLVTGNVFDIGPTNLGPALMTLTSGGSVNLRGLDTDMDWDVATGRIASDIGMFCFDRPAGGALVVKHVPDLRWSATSGQVTGTFSCP